MEKKWAWAFIAIVLVVCINLVSLGHSSAAKDPVNETSGPVKGFADIHIHQMAEYAYASGWYHGSHKGMEKQAMRACDGGNDHARTKAGALINEVLGKVPGTWGDTGWHPFRKYGCCTYENWPNWDSIAHQQVWEGHLKQAYESGLRLYIMSAVNFRPLCELILEQNKKNYMSCEDHASVDLQLQAAIDFADQREWVQIAYTPDQARTIINSGKLAMIMAIEISELFPTGDWRQQLDHYYDLGVRSIQVAHQLDNRFAGAAPHHFIFKLFQAIDDLKNKNFKDIGFDLDDNLHNLKGLTDEGKELVRAMMDTNMIVDIAHLSEKSVHDIYDISKEYNYYPLIVSHGHLRSIMMEKKQKQEKTVPDWIVKVIRQTGGIFGIRTGAEQVKTYSYSAVPNDCDGSTKSFAQAYQYATRGLKVDVALASDLNGFIQQLRPRFGGGLAACGASGNLGIIRKQQNLQSQGAGTEFDTKGFAHIGLIKDIINDLKAFGIDTSALEHSAETMIKVWQRCYDQTRSALPVDDFNTQGIE